MNGFWVGIDAGGTKTRIAYRQNTDMTVGELTGEGVNIQRDGVEEAANRLFSLINQVSSPVPKHTWICAGIAGAGDQVSRSNLLDSLVSKSGIPAVQIHLVSDAKLALRTAFGETEPGILIIAGTGSILMGRQDDGTLLRAGGWGSLLGDEGGGYKIGLAGLKAVADNFDGGPSTRLKVLLCERHEICDKEMLRERVYRKGLKIQTIAPLVLEAANKGDGVASQIVQHQVLAIIVRLQWLLRKMSRDAAAISFAGGLFNDTYFRNTVTARIQKHIPNCNLIERVTTPEVTALEWAVTRFQNRS